MELILGLFANEQVYNLLSTAILGGMGFILARIDRKNKHAALRLRAKDAVAAGVNELYPLVKAMKTANADGKLTETQKQEVERQATMRAVEIGKDVGVDVLGTLGSGILGAVLKESLALLKSGNVKLPPEVAALFPDVPPEGFSPKAIENETDN